MLLIPVCCAAQLSAEVSEDRDRNILLGEVLTLVSSEDAELLFGTKRGKSRLFPVCGQRR